MQTQTETELTRDITEAELSLFLREKKQLTTMREEVESLSRALNRREAGFIARLKAGAQAAREVFIMTRRRQSIPWLSIVRQELGISAIVAAKDRFPVTFYEELRIEE
jgi:hypothetical protein